MTKQDKNRLIRIQREVDKIKKDLSRDVSRLSEQILAMQELKEGLVEGANLLEKADLDLNRAVDAIDTAIQLSE